MYLLSTAMSEFGSFTWYPPPRSRSTFRQRLHSTICYQYACWQRNLPAWWTLTLYGRSPLMVWCYGEVKTVKLRGDHLLFRRDSQSPQSVTTCLLSKEKASKPSPKGYPARRRWCNWRSRQHPPGKRWRWKSPNCLRITAPWWPLSAGPSWWTALASFRICVDQTQKMSWSSWTLECIVTCKHGRFAHLSDTWPEINAPTSTPR